MSAIGLLSAMLLISDPPPVGVTSAAELLNLGPSQANGQRTIASIDPAQTAPKVVKEALMEINCGQDNQLLEAWGPRLRLKGTLCVPQDASVTSTKVSNKTNGYAATVFRQSGQFTTDYINLNEGKNEINILFETESGPVEKNVTVIRNSPAQARK